MGTGDALSKWNGSGDTGVGRPLGVWETLRCVVDVRRGWRGGRLSGVIVVDVRVWSVISGRPAVTDSDNANEDADGAQITLPLRACIMAFCLITSPLHQAGFCRTKRDGSIARLADASLGDEYRPSRRVPETLRTLDRLAR